MTQPGITRAFISLGSNLGDLEGNLGQARENLNDLHEARLGPCSPVYFTEPQDVRNQPWFANQVVALDCGPIWTARELLRTLLEIEDRMGRVREQDKGPRIIDLDLLLFGSRQHDSPELTLPHPRLHERAFVLVPLQDIAPDLVFPDGTSLSKALARLSFQVQGRDIFQ
ncbi:2-amino-4-hydroxy-6-hydroxymethyldihydropteridine diphosphokinase [Desulfonatronum sp. SC1]|uniref:2-amino-4-hydroxy-6- hydroxymethyldihydropteridine diphosphokinase n=1 Tax=Desulfonatronum sp. SC1 TaxID=2109626 RepID=UPI000D30E3D3|nr:2-amino-4-hydroxy-6-hydroxymethyldihydropteridine diphosphokinase [Desulfonatronum sp. SC1]PTN35630.1 2-amino-4-hydroxy-6-hydroxymethyldihydropteridine diphosphokinase [Desulfonatronum sp. SC1]